MNCVLGMLDCCTSVKSAENWITPDTSAQLSGEAEIPDERKLCNSSLALFKLVFRKINATCFEFRKDAFVI